MSDPVAMVTKPRSDWKRRAIRAELERDDAIRKAYHYYLMTGVAAIVAVASLLFALVK